MSKDKLEGFLIGIGAGILVTAFLQACEQLRKKPVEARQLRRVPMQSPRANAPAQPPNRSVRASTLESTISGVRPARAIPNYCIASLRPGIRSSQQHITGGVRAG